MVPMRALMVTLVMTAGSAIEQAPPAAFDVNAIAKKIQQAQFADDVPALKEARAACLTALAAKPERSAMLRYTVAYVDWRLGFMPGVPGREQDAMFDEAIDQLTLALKEDPAFAEGYALLATTYGGKISMHPDLGMTLGMRSGEMLDKAKTLAPENPRVVLIEALSLYNTPAEYGGSIAQAEKLLKRALGLFAEESPAKPWPNWGRFDAHAWLGQALAKRGDLAGARAEYDRALQIAPNSGWVKHVLVPALTKK